MKKYRVLIVGAGHMGRSHALAYHEFPNCEIKGIVTPGDSKRHLNDELGGTYPLYDEYYAAFRAVRPEITVISTYVDTHYEYSKHALENDSHVFVEKPLCETVEKAEELIELSLKKNLKMVVGFILRYHPGWNKFIETARGLGKPLVMRMNLNQQSSGNNWLTHKQLLKDTSPIVDCGVHYVDVMRQMTGADPVKVTGIQSRLSHELGPQEVNYGQLQVTFADGSVGWYEAGWGPMMSETAYFIKDVIGPKGSVSIATDNFETVGSSDVSRHVTNQKLKIHHSELRDGDGEFSKKDEEISLENEPNHDRLCCLEQQHLLKAIEEDLDLRKELYEGIAAMKIVLAADLSAQNGETVNF